jgi:hypothetical protein
MEIETTKDSQDLSLGSYGSVEPTPQPVSESSAAVPVLAIGDIHGHLDRFEALLKQEGLLDRCDGCSGFGTSLGLDEIEQECNKCDGDGWARTDKPATVVLLGDVGHFGITRMVRLRATC